MKEFQFQVPSKKVRHGSGIYMPNDFTSKQEPDPAPDATVHGIPIGSVEEWRWAMAANFYKIEFDYQVDVAGGKSVSGGSVLDFLMYTDPLWTPVNIKGVYWHSGYNALDDEFRGYKLRQYYSGMIADAIDVLTWQIPTIAATKQLFKELIL